MAKVSIGLRGWRFDEEDVFTGEGKLRPFEEMPEEVRDRVSRLTSLVNSPCDACWLIHGDENLQNCSVAAVVYGEPLSEVILCGDHETDFVYWYRECGGSEYRGDPQLQDEFHAWFRDGGRAPEDYEGVEHVSTAPEDLPDVQGPDPSVLDVELPEERRERIDLRDGEVYRGEEATRQESDDDGDEPDLEDADVDLSQDYPS